jgi:predicted RNA-binding protein with EMAP domain
MALARNEISEGARDTRVAIQEQAMTEANDQAVPLIPPRVFVRVWQNGIFEDQRTTLAMD